MDLDRRFWAVGPIRAAGERAPVVARDRIAGGTVVLKYAPTSRDELAGELRAEGGRLSELEHPALLSLRARFDGVRDPWGNDRVAGFATPWIDGSTLIDGLAEVPVAARLTAFAQLLDVTQYMHRRGLLHLDLKPDNALISAGEGNSGPRLTLLDLGSARPLDAGPGEAGGTLGYAAPEVLTGQAASIAADVFSLGAILYELLTGSAAFPGTDGSVIRRAVLAGELFPVRALAPSVPHDLAQLVERMLNRRPARRPHSIVELQAALSDAGVPPIYHTGAPPFVGRGELSDRLRALVRRRGGGRTVLVGPQGSGRTRLARTLFDAPRAAGAGRGVMDLSRAGDLLRALDGLACTVAGSLPDLESLLAWEAAASAVFSTWKGPKLAVFLGDLDRFGLTRDQRESVARVVGQMAAGGLQVVWTSVVEHPDAVSLHLPPLGTAAVAELGSYFGVLSTQRLAEVATRTGGWPGAVSEALAPSSMGRGQGDVPLARALARLAPGVPANGVASLTIDLQEGLRALVAAGVAHWAADGRLYLSGYPEVTPDDDQLAARLLQGVPDAIDPLWVALSAARIAQVDRAVLAWGAVDASRVERRTALDELVEHLSNQGHEAARVELARLREERGDLDGAIDLLASLKAPRPVDRLRLVRALRRAGRLEDAEQQVQVAEAAGAASGELLLEQARIHFTRRENDLAEDMCEQAEAADPHLQDGSALGLRIQLALRRTPPGGAHPGPKVDALLDRVEALAADRAPLPSRTLSSAGRLLARIGQLERGAALLLTAAEQADEEGDARAAAGIRLNAGGVLEGLGRGRRARQAFRDGLVIAEQAEDPQLVVRLRYSLANLELRSGRLPSAEQHIAAFQATTVDHSDPEVRVRGVWLRSRLLLARGQYAEALESITSVKCLAKADSIVRYCDIAHAQALLGLDRGAEVLDVLAKTGAGRTAFQDAQTAALRGRAHLAVARHLLTAARIQVPDKPDPLERIESGEILLSQAGEDLDPSTFSDRRADLDRAARLLRGPSAATAATLRDRLLDGPGAALEGIVELTEAFHDAESFPAALARIVSEALGAYRVLIMLRIPGLGRQVTWTELSGAEAAGIGNEVLRRIQDPEDYWLAHNAFADPHLRQTSQTVRTFELKSLLAVAIPSRSQAVGALYVDDLHRANRFDQQDVRMLQRLAGAVGALLPMLSRGARRDQLDEPKDVLGVLLSSEERVKDIEYAVSMLAPGRNHNLLVTGPTGAGKSVLSRRIATDVLGLRGIETVVLRRSDPQMLITQLTGAKRGEFTGALDREGAIQRCIRERKALFLDEVQNLDDAGQQILLPLLEVRDRHFGGLTGASTRLNAPLQIITGTNVDITGTRWKSHFREDLWWRMSAVHIDLPSLSSRGPEAVYRYLRAMLHDHGLPDPEDVFETRALHLTTNWSWPGNLRQLQVFTDRAASVHQTTGLTITCDDLPRLGMNGAQETGVSGSVSTGAGLDDAMVGHVMDTLKRAGWVQKRAATQLDMTPSRLNKFLARHGLIDEVKRLRIAHRTSGESVPPRRVHQPS